MEVIKANNELQRIPEWYEERLGRFSCSNFYRLMTEPKLKADKEAGNLSDGAMTYVYECIAERLTGKKAKDDFTSVYTEWGIENEPFAKAIYNEVFGVKVEDSKYIPYGEYAGGSPDGLIGEDGLIEIKCPYTITSHLEHKLDTLKDKPIYYWQCLGYLLISRRKWIDFVSYHPHYPARLQFFKVRVERAEVEEDLNRLESKLKKATELLTLLLNSLS